MKNLRPCRHGRALVPQSGLTLSLTSHRKLNGDLREHIAHVRLGEAFRNPQVSTQVTWRAKVSLDCDGMGQGKLKVKRRERV
jgi:hypothetical protein